MQKTTWVYVNLCSIAPLHPNMQSRCFRLLFFAHYLSCLIKNIKLSCPGRQCNMHPQKLSGICFLESNSHLWSQMQVLIHFLHELDNLEIYGFLDCVFCFYTCLLLIPAEAKWQTYCSLFLTGESRFDRIQQFVNYISDLETK